MDALPIHPADQVCPRCRGAGTLPIETSAGPGPACHLCHQTGKVGPTVWRVSPWGFQVHGFFAPAGVASEAACSHTAPTAQLVEDDGTAVKCQACLMIIGRALAEQHGDRDRWA